MSARSYSAESSKHWFINAEKLLALLKNQGLALSKIAVDCLAKLGQAAQQGRLEKRLPVSEINQALEILSKEGVAIEHIQQGIAGLWLLFKNDAINHTDIPTLDIDCLDKLLVKLFSAKPRDAKDAKAAHAPADSLFVTVDEITRIITRANDFSAKALQVNLWTLQNTLAQLTQLELQTPASVARYWALVK